MTKHTPAPWYYNDGKNLGYWPYVQRGRSGGNVIQSSLGQENAQADAHLIATAPEMYDALKNLLAMVERQKDFNDDRNGEMIDICHKILAKAEGR